MIELTPTSAASAPPSQRPASRSLTILGGNLLGAAFACYLLAPNLEYVLRFGAGMGLVYVLQQAWVALAFLTRRAPRSVSHRPLDWVAAYAGWLISFLVRPGGYHPPWGPAVGFWVQVCGLALWAWAFAVFARSYGIVAADRGLVTAGPYAIVRHPLYAAYMLGGAGFLLQSLTLRNVLVTAIAVSWQLVRIAAEERHLAGGEYDAYRARVRRRLIPGVW